MLFRRGICCPFPLFIGLGDIMVVDMCCEAEGVVICTCMLALCENFVTSVFV